jgi:hypothetical protein
MHEPDGSQTTLAINLPTGIWWLSPLGICRQTSAPIDEKAAEEQLFGR